MNVNIIKPSG